MATWPAVSFESGSSVSVPPATSGFDVAEATVGVNAGTAATNLASHGSLAFGVKVSNTHASQYLYVGFANTTKGTQFTVRVGPGEVSDWLPVSNSNLLWVAGSGAATSYVYGGC